MRARVLPSDSPEAVAEAVRVIRAGGLVAFPTETVYGLGANALDARAAARIFEVKRRPAFDPLIVHVADASAIDALIMRSDRRARQLAERFWPGPLTLVLPKRESVPDIVTAGFNTVAVRVPDHAATLAWLAAAGVPVAAPSANLFGRVSPTTAAHVAEQLGEAVDLILDGGPCRVGIESTIVALDGQEARVLRLGGVTVAEIEQCIGSVSVALESSGRPEAPGQLSKHYATRAPLKLLAAGAVPQASSRGRIGLLAFRTPAEAAGYSAVEVLAPDGDLRTAAARLFGALRHLDAANLDRIDAEPVPEQGIGAAIMDRLRRASADA